MTYKLKQGVVIHPFGPHCAPVKNEDLTDEKVEWLVDSGRATIDQFEEVEDEAENSKKTKNKK